jgi:adenine/guanine phosphoribosyltransferase-like PRPP-binding protein
MLVVDDLLAKGGTAVPRSRLVEASGGTVSAGVFFIELDLSRGAERLAPHF